MSLVAARKDRVRPTGLVQVGCVSGVVGIRAMTKILLADDHDLVRDTLKLFLEAGGMGPVTAVGSVAEAEAALADPEAEPFRIVILDYTMPGMNGLDGLRRILRVAAPVPVVLLSGSPAAAVARAAIGAGARGFLSKTMSATAPCIRWS